jgi:hypothetical protein
MDSNIKIHRTVCQGYQENSARVIRPSLKTSGVFAHLLASCAATRQQMAGERRAGNQSSGILGQAATTSLNLLDRLTGNGGKHSVQENIWS